MNFVKRYRPLVSKHWPLGAALVVLYTALTGCLVAALVYTGGHFAYALDDPYIHMAAAKNFVAHGVWGVTPYGFSSASSSIIWPLLIALDYAVCGVGAWAPLLLNVVVSSVLLAAVYFLLARHGISPAINCACLLAVALCAPLPAVVFTGLEHPLQILVALLLVYFSGRILAEPAADEKKVSTRLQVACLALAPLVTMTRFEGAFMVAVVCLIAVVRRRFRYAVALALLGAAPVIIYGLISVFHGSQFLPNSVLLKGNAPDAFEQPFASIAADSRLIVYYRQAVDSLGFKAVKGLVYTPHLFALMIIAATAWGFATRRGRRPWTPCKIMLMIFAGTMLLHLQLAATGYFYRYEAYLVVLGLVASVLAAGNEPPEFLRSSKPLARCAIGVAACLLALPFVHRAAVSLVQTPRASTNVYQQQCQMGAFLGRYYAGQAVAAGDIGAINFYADIDLLDLLGLGSVEVAKARKKGCFNTEMIRAMAAQRGVQIAVVFDHVYDSIGGLPAEWQKVGQWEISKNVACQESTVAFYAVDPRQKDRLAQHLREFSRQLPASVIQRGPYLDRQSPLAAR